MKYRIPLAAAAVTAVLLATGLAWADGSSDSSSGSSSAISPTSTSSTSTSSTSTSSTSTSSAVTGSTLPTPTVTAPDSTPSLRQSNVSIPDGTSRTFVIENAGTVIVGRSGNTLRIIVATPNAGWSSEIEVASGREVEGDFRSGDLRVKYNFELEDGTVRVRIEVRNENNDGGDDNSRGDDDNSGPSSGDDDDNSGPGSSDDDDDDDDNSGPGSGDDDDDDNSGPGSGDDDDSDDDD